MKTGEDFHIPYPFKRVVVVGGYDDEGPNTFESWAPGCDHDEYGATAHGEGEMLLMVIDVHRPGKYPERVFYIRQWKDPNGKVFGKKNLRITTTGNFRQMLKGYRYEYEVEP